MFYSLIIINNSFNIVSDIPSQGYSVGETTVFVKIFPRIFDFQFGFLQSSSCRGNYKKILYSYILYFYVKNYYS